MPERLMVALTEEEIGVLETVIRHAGKHQSTVFSDVDTQWPVFAPLEGGGLRARIVPTAKAILGEKSAKPEIRYSMEIWSNREMAEKATNDVTHIGWRLHSIVPLPDGQLLVTMQMEQ